MVEHHRGLSTQILERNWSLFCSIEYDSSGVLSGQLSSRPSAPGFSTYYVSPMLDRAALVPFSEG